jgi:hypothetical protein
MPMQNDLDADILQWKRKLIEHVVYLICIRRNISTPYINFKGCSNERPNELAHYHPDQHVICVSERQLRVQSLEELKRTAVHEVTHALGFHSHNADFERINREINIELALYNPSSVISEHDGSKTAGKLGHGRKIRSGINTCSANGCNKKAVNICRYCMKRYCQAHSEALMISTLAQMNMLNQYDAEKRIKLEEDWNKEGGHPCHLYTANWNTWYDKKKMAQYDAFGVFLGDDKKIASIPKEPPSLFVYPIEKNAEKGPNSGDKISEGSKKSKGTTQYLPLTQQDLKATRAKLGIDIEYTQPVKSTAQGKNNNGVGNEDIRKPNTKKKKSIINKLRTVFGFRHK